MYIYYTCIYILYVYINTQFRDNNDLGDLNDRQPHNILTYKELIRRLLNKTFNSKSKQVHATIEQLDRCHLTYEQARWKWFHFGRHWILSSFFSLLPCSSFTLHSLINYRPRLEMLYIKVFFIK